MLPVALNAVWTHRRVVWGGRWVATKRDPRHTEPGHNRRARPGADRRAV